MGFYVSFIKSVQFLLVLWILTMSYDKDVLFKKVSVIFFFSFPFLYRCVEFTKEEDQSRNYFSDNKI